MGISAVQCEFTAEWIAIDESAVETLADGTRYVAVRCPWCDAYGTSVLDTGYDSSVPQIHIHILESTATGENAVASGDDRKG